MDVRAAVCVIVGALALTSTSRAQDAGQWIVRVGVHPIQPKPHHHRSLQVGDSATLTVDATYMFARRWGLELLAAWPADHDITQNGVGKVAETKLLPPTVSVQYHFFDPNGRIRAYVGAGLNYTVFTGEGTTGSLSGADLELDSSVGPAVQLGLDLDLNDTWLVNIDARWFDIDADATLNGAPFGTLEIDPYAFGLSIGRRF